MRPSSGDEGLGPAYLVNGINDSGGIFPPEPQGNFYIPFVIDECCNLLPIGGSEILRSEVPPPLEDILLCCRDKLVVMGGWGGKTEITRSESPSGPSVAVSEEFDQGGHRRRYRTGRKVVKWVVPLLTDIDNGRVILYFQSIRRR